MINVIGLGYIGLPTALMLASHGVEVVGTDYNKELVATLDAGHTTFKEDGLDELFQNALDAGRDVCSELEILGKENICQIHCTDTDGVTLPDNTRLDLKKVKQTLDRMGWSGWLVMERSRDKNDVHNVKKNYGTNARYLKSIFQ